MEFTLIVIVVACGDLTYVRSVWPGLHGIVTCKALVTKYRKRVRNGKGNEPLQGELDSTNKVCQFLGSPKTSIELKQDNKYLSSFISKSFFLTGAISFWFILD